ncbi:NUDIX domain-containing protein [Streptomyces sp. NPDC047017]|uniref:NUDIX domain-containing protein n=1 Tax=Streptomyces sp. NPDC047017 TaxID=3155024 RepID=UPI0033E4EA01
MALEQAAPGTVQAVVVYDGRLLLVGERDDWALPSGGPEPAESAQAAAARCVYELTGYLVDGSSVLGPEAAAEGEAVTAVVCQLLSESPSSGARLAPERMRWFPLGEVASVELPEAVRRYLRGHTPV